MLIQEVSYLIQLLLSHLVDLILPQDVLDAPDGPLRASIGIAVLRRCVHMVDANLPQHLGELGPE